MKGERERERVPNRKEKEEIGAVALPASCTCDDGLAYDKSFKTGILTGVAASRRFTKSSSSRKSFTCRFSSSKAIVVAMAAVIVT
jgi:hypothetical protein